MAIRITEIFLGVAVLLLILYRYLTKNFDYWKKRQIKGPKPIPVFGNFKDVILGRIHQADYFKKIYDDYPNEPMLGIFFRSTPALLVKDPEILKDVFIKSFSTFPDRGVKIHEDIDPLAQHLLFLDHKKWKPLRKTLTPVFSSGKLKEMFYLINECADCFRTYIEKLALKGEPIECRELTAKFTTDVIGVCAFGLDMKAMSDEGESEFRKVGRALFDDTWYNKARLATRRLPHWLAKFLKPIARDDKMINFFVNAIKETMEYRKKNNVRRHDFVDLLMDIKDHPDKIGEEEISDIMITAQAFVFFAAGFETSSTTMSHAMYELALNSDIQDKLREEVNAAYKDNDGKLTYDCVREMKYLDKVFKETLRKYPPAFTLARVAINDHTFADSEISVQKGTSIVIPVYAIHHDPNIYSEPEKFDPERFEEEIASARQHMSYLPFGDGPRNCIGERFARNQTKLGLATVVNYFRLKVCDKTCIPYEKRMSGQLLAPKDGLYLKIEKL